MLLDGKLAFQNKARIWRKEIVDSQEALYLTWLLGRDFSCKFTASWILLPSTEGQASLYHWGFWSAPAKKTGLSPGLLQPYSREQFHTKLSFRKGTKKKKLLPHISSWSKASPMNGKAPAASTDFASGWDLLGVFHRSVQPLHFQLWKTEQSLSAALPCSSLQTLLSLSRQQLLI